MDSEQAPAVAAEDITYSTDVPLHTRLSIRMKDLGIDGPGGLGTRIKGVMQNENIVYVGEYVTKTERELTHPVLKPSNYAKVCHITIKETLAKLGLTTGMDRLEGWTRGNAADVSPVDIAKWLALGPNPELGLIKEKALQTEVPAGEKPALSFNAAQLDKLKSYDTAYEVPEKVLEQIKAGVIDLSDEEVGQTSGLNFHIALAKLAGEDLEHKILIAVDRKKDNKNEFETVALIGLDDEFFKTVQAYTAKSTTFERRHPPTMGSSHTDFFAIPLPGRPVMTIVRQRKALDAMKVPQPDVVFKSGPQ